MAVQSTLAEHTALSPVDPAVYAAIRHAHRPPRRLWLYLIRLLLQYAITVPVVLAATPLVILRNLFPFLRRHPAWTFKTGVSTTLTRITIMCMGLIRFAPAPHSESGWLQGDSAVGGFLAFLFQILAWRSTGKRIWADTKTVPHLSHLHGRRLDEVWVSPPPADWLRGLLAVRDTARPLDEQLVSSPLYRGRPLIDPGFAKRHVKCYWYLSRGRTLPPLPNEDGGTRPRLNPVLLYCHGGAGVSFSAGDNFMGASLAANLARTADIDVFTVDYDLAPYAKYPTTIVQLFGAWLYLVVDLGYHPAQIFFGGDSYGGQATLLLNRYLRDVWPLLTPPSAESLACADASRSPEWIKARVAKYSALLGGQPVRPPPATPGLVLFSPWLHTEDEGEIFVSRATAAKHDIVTMAYMHWGTDCLEMTHHKNFKAHALPVSSPWISPVFIPSQEIATMPPMWVGNGGAEALLSEGTDFVRRARAAGADIEHHVERGMPHDFYSIPFEINNAKKHYALLDPWLKTQAEAAQRRAGLRAPATTGKDTLEAAWAETAGAGPLSASTHDMEAQPLSTSLTESGVVVPSIQVNLAAAPRQTGRHR